MTPFMWILVAKSVPELAAGLESISILYIPFSPSSWPAGGPWGSETINLKCSHTNFLEKCFWACPDSALWSPWRVNVCGREEYELKSSWYWHFSSGGWREGTGLFKVIKLLFNCPYHVILCPSNVALFLEAETTEAADDAVKAKSMPILNIYNNHLLS